MSGRRKGRRERRLKMFFLLCVSAFYLCLSLLAFLFRHQFQMQSALRERRFIAEGAESRAAKLEETARRNYAAGLAYFQTPGVRALVERDLSNHERILALRGLAAFVGGTEDLKSIYLFNPKNKMVYSSDDEVCSEDWEHFAERDLLRPVPANEGRPIPDARRGTKREKTSVPAAQEQAEDYHDLLLRRGGNEGQRVFLTQILRNESGAQMILNTDLGRFWKTDASHPERGSGLYFRGELLCRGGEEERREALPRRLTSLDEARRQGLRLFSVPLWNGEAVYLEYVEDAQFRRLIAEASAGQRVLLVFLGIVLVSLPIFFLAWHSFLRPFLESLALAEDESLRPSKFAEFLRRLRREQALLRLLDGSFVAGDFERLCRQKELRLYLLPHEALRATLPGEGDADLTLPARMPGRDFEEYRLQLAEEEDAAGFSLFYSLILRGRLLCAPEDVARSAENLKELYELLVFERAQPRLPEADEPCGFPGAERDLAAAETPQGKGRALPETAAAGEGGGEAGLPYIRAEERDLEARSCSEPVFGAGVRSLFGAEDEAAFERDLIRWRRSLLSCRLRELKDRLEEEWNSLREERTGGPGETKTRGTGEESPTVLCEKIVRRARELYRERDEKRRDKQRVWTEKARDIAERSLEDPNLSLRLLADELGLSSEYLGRCLRECLGYSAAQMIHQLRIEKSLEYLKESTLSIREICRRIGIENSAYFYTLFKNHCGCTPGVYRQRARQERASSPCLRSEETAGERACERTGQEADPE